MLMAAVAIYAVGVHKDSQRKTALLDVQNAATALEFYRASTGHYPEPDQGFAPLIKTRALKTLPLDPWGTPLSWKLDARGEPVVISFGADGRAGGVEDDEDLSSAAP